MCLSSFCFCFPACSHRMTSVTAILVPNKYAKPQYNNNCRINNFRLCAYFLLLWLPPPPPPLLLFSAIKHYKSPDNYLKSAQIWSHNVIIIGKRKMDRSEWAGWSERVCVRVCHICVLVCNSSAHAKLHFSSSRSHIHWFGVVRSFAVRFVHSFSPIYSSSSSPFPPAGFYSGAQKCEYERDTFYYQVVSMR